MSSRLLNLYLFYTSLLGDICLDDDGPFDTLSPGRIRVARLHLIATRWQAGRTAAFTGALASWSRSDTSHTCSATLVSKPQSASSTSAASSPYSRSRDHPYIAFFKQVARAGLPALRRP
jgi:hypothetical protein